MSKTRMPALPPGAIPMFALGQSVHQALIWSRSVVASFTPCFVIGCLPGLVQSLPLEHPQQSACTGYIGTTRRPRFAYLSARSFMLIGIVCGQSAVLMLIGMVCGQSAVLIQMTPSYAR